MTKKKTTKKKTTKRKPGRKKKITKKVEAKLIELMSDDMSQAKACKYVGISEETICKHKRENPEFTERLEQAREETRMIARKSVKDGMKKDWRAGAWYLERRDPRYKDKLEIEEKPSLVQNMFGKSVDK